MHILNNGVICILAVAALGVCISLIILMIHTVEPDVALLLIKHTQVCFDTTCNCCSI